MEYVATFTGSVERNYETRSFRFTRDPAYDFEAGQFFYLTLDKDRTKHFSHSDSPGQKEFIEFTTRLTGSDYKNAVNALSPGDKVRIAGPSGEFTYRPEYKKIAFLSGGIGTTAVRSICKYIAEEKIGADVHFLYENASVRDILFREEFDELVRKNKNIKVSRILKDPPKDWKGLSGEIGEELIKRTIPDYAQRMFYICGPPKTVLKLRNAVKGLGVAEKNMLLENFVGY